MELLFILRDATGSSAVGTLTAARAAEASGKEVAVLVTQGALAAFAGGSFEWPRALAGPPMRMALADAGKEMGLPIQARGAARILDPKALADEVAEGCWLTRDGRTTLDALGFFRGPSELDCNTNQLSDDSRNKN